MLTAKRGAASGFTLLELTLVLAVVGMLAQGYWQWRSTTMEEAAVQRTVDGLLQIDEALYSFRIDTGAWPGNITEVAPYLPNLANVDAVAGTAGVNGVGLPYSIAAAGIGIEVSTQLQTAAQADAVAREFPNTSRVDPATSTVSIGLPVPGLENSHAALMALDGSRPMAGALLMGGNDITGAGRVRAATVAADSLVHVGGGTIGDGCAANALGTSGRGVLCCVSGTWALCEAASATTIVEGTVGSGGFFGSRLNAPPGFSTSDCNLRLEPIPVAVHAPQLGQSYSWLATTPTNGSATPAAAGTHWNVIVTGGLHAGRMNYRITCNRA